MTPERKQLLVAYALVLAWPVAMIVWRWVYHRWIRDR